MRRIAAATLTLLLVLGAAVPAFAAPRWKRRLGRMAGSHPVSVLVRVGDRKLFSARATHTRIPASNQKLLMSMAILDRMGARNRVETRALVRPASVPAANAGQADVKDGVVTGDLWVVGGGDPTLGTGGGWAKGVRSPVTRIGRLARAIERSGVRRINGRIRGSRTPFHHDWWADGWKSSFPSEQVALPSALSLRGNVYKGHHTSNPERLVARALKRKLEARGVKVSGRAGAGRHPDNLAQLARVRSAPLWQILKHTNRVSSNFFAEVLGKRLGVAARGRPGTIAKGAGAICGWIARHGAHARCYDSSGLSYKNHVNARSIVRLLGVADRKPWGDELRASLPQAGKGTLEDRLDGVRIRAKTGTLDRVSALSGWVWLERLDRWARFSILGNGMDYYSAKNLEDKMVRLIAAKAR